MVTAGPSVACPQAAPRTPAPPVAVQVYTFTCPRRPPTTQPAHPVFDVTGSPRAHLRSSIWLLVLTQPYWWRSLPYRTGIGKVSVGHGPNPPYKVSNHLIRGRVHMPPTARIIFLGFLRTDSAFKAAAPPVTPVFPAGRQRP
jgi:hypothetical protein